MPSLSAGSLVEGTGRAVEFGIVVGNYEYGLDITGYWARRDWLFR